MEVALWYVSSTPRNTYQCNTYHLSFQDWFAAEKIGSPPEVIVNPHFSGNLWRCLSFVKCSLNQTKCQSTLYHMGEASAMVFVFCCVERRVSAGAWCIMRHRLHHDASRRLCVIRCKCLQTDLVLSHVIIEVFYTWWISLSHQNKQTRLYCMSAFIGQHNQCFLLSIAQLKEVHLPVKGVFQSLNLLLGSIRR